MDNIKNTARKLKDLKIWPENDNFELFEEYASKKQKGNKVRFIWLYSAVAILLLMFVIGSIIGNREHSITDFCQGNSCLCDKSIDELQKKGYNFREVSVKGDCIESCSDCGIGKWYAANELRGVILQIAADGNEIFRIRLTKDYKGKLPNGRYVELSEMQLDDIRDALQTEVWYADNCFDYASFSQGNFRILFKPGNPVESGYTNLKNDNLSGMQVEAIEILNSCMLN